MADGEDPGREAWMLLFELFRSQRRELTALHTEIGLNMAQAHLLKSIERPGGAPMSELAEALICDNSYITGLVDKLEDKGLVQRLASPDDRRVKLIALTEAGTAIREKIVLRFSQPPPFIDALPLEDKRALRDIFMKASKSVDPA